MSHIRACSQKFILFLYENNHLGRDFRIEKGHAQKLYNESFKKEHKSKVNFYVIFMHVLKFLKRQKDLSIMIFNQNKVMKLVKDKSQIDLQFKKGSGVKKNMLISHSFFFNKNKKSEETLLSRQECKLCSVQFKNTKCYEDHLKEDKHAFLEELNKAVKEANTKQSILQFTIPDTPIFNNVILRKEVPKIMHLNVKNVAKEPVKISTIQTKTGIDEVVFNPSCPYELAPSGVVELILTICSTKDGILHFPILFKTEINNNMQLFHVELVFHTHDEFFDDLHPVEPYIRSYKPVLKEYIEHIDSGERPNIFPQMAMKVPLKPCILPSDIAVVLNAGLKPFEGMTQSQQSQLTNIKNLLDVENKKRCLQPSNYTNLLDTLLYIEEHQMNRDIREYDKENQTLNKAGSNLLELEVPGLAEHRPSVIFADSVFVRESKNSKILYEGFVHKVKETSVLLRFSKHFMDTVYIKGKKFYVSFTFNRYALKVEHQAVQFTKTDNIAHLLFPVKITKEPMSKSEITWFNRDIANNPEQQQAVHSILKRTAMPSPYLIFGPPGTGKTMTVVESVKQIHKLTNHKVLICTPSNNAANEVTKRLIDTIPTTDLFRLIAPSFPYQQIPKNLFKYINYKNGNYYQPKMTEMAKYRILIITLVSAGKLLNSGCPKDHFGYIFIDESGQATETETLIPIARILSNNAQPGTLSGQIVLAGDPRQLGPVIHSTLALDYGFGISMLERLMDRSDPYKKDDSNKYNSNALTKLINNYRSHPVIIKQSNELFYENELKSAGDKLINAALNWETLPNREFPLIFHSVVGIDQREKNSPSFFNIQEVQAVLFYLDKLMGCKMQGITIMEEHIGIVSPYKKQVEKIKKACSNKRYSDKLMVGTVEQIQGQERLIIIISTVRSKTEFVKFDNKFLLGFLNNPKRFNVAITRAKALLIIVGNPNILQYDEHWRSLISYCKENNAITGEKFDFNVKDSMEETLSDLQNMSLMTEANSEDGPNFSRGNL